MKKTSNILIIDDFPQTLDMLKTLLEDSGYIVYTAESGASGLQILENTSVDLILLDILIPDMDGYNLCRQIKEDPRYKDIPIIFLTALNDRQSIVRGLQIGAVDYITKPFDLDEVSARISIHLELKNARETILHLNQHLRTINSEYEEEIVHASHFIRSVLPERLFSPVKIDWKFYPSTRLGGDILNYFFINEKQLIAYVIDVSGHGLVAALLSISITNILRSHSIPGVDFTNPREVLEALNERFLIETQDGKYFTIWYGVLNIETGQLTFASGGHPPAVLLRKGTMITVERLNSPGIGIGLFDDCKIINQSVALRESDELYIFSDGVFEIQNASDTLLGYDGLVEELVKNSGVGNDALSLVVQNLRKYKGNANFEDDFTLLRIRV